MLVVYLLNGGCGMPDFRLPAASAAVQQVCLGWTRLFSPAALLISNHMSWLDVIICVYVCDFDGNSRHTVFRLDLPTCWLFIC